MRNPYETQITEIAQSASEAISACQAHAEETDVSIIAFALESVRKDVLTMVRVTSERDRLFNRFVSNIAEDLGADSKTWQESWREFSENGGYQYGQ